MRIARIPYLNSVPFYRGLTVPEPMSLVDCVPRQLAQQAAAGEIAAGLMPVAAYFEQQDRFERLGHFGVAVRGRARSAILFSREPIRRLDGRTIAVTDESATTVRLLQVLLAQNYQMQNVTYLPERSPAADALLLIGDEALRFAKTNTLYPFEIDVAFEWWLWQHMPFVFAVWVVRKDLNPQDKKRIEANVAKALAVNSTQLESIAEETAPAFGMSKEECHVYLSSFIYRLSQQEEQGMALFQELLQAQGVPAASGR